MKHFILIFVIVVNGVLIYMSLKNIVLTYVSEQKIASLEKNLKKTSATLEEEKNKNSTLKEKYENLDSLKQEVQKELKEKMVQAEELAMELAKEKHAKQELQRKLDKAETQIKTLEMAVSQERDKSKQLEERLQRMADRLEKQEGDKASLLERLNSSIKERDQLKNQLKTMEEKNATRYSLAEITVSEKKYYAGMILNVNERFNFCIVSIGKDDGIVPGIELIVYRGEKLIAKIIIEKVFDKMSSAKITSVQDTQTVQTEDKVRKIE